MDQTNFLSYDQIRKNQTVQHLRFNQMPEAYFISMPMPTLRLGKAAFVQFAGPAVRTPGKPVFRAAPDRWWALDAKTGYLLLYSMDNIFSFASGMRWDGQEVTPSGLTIAQAEEYLREWEIEMNELAPLFFRDIPGDVSRRKKVLNQASIMFDQRVLDQYHAVAPDFFEWLEKDLP